MQIVFHWNAFKKDSSYIHFVGSIIFKKTNSSIFSVLKLQVQFGIFIIVDLINVLLCFNCLYYFHISFKLCSLYIFTAIFIVEITICMAPTKFVILSMINSLIIIIIFSELLSLHWTNLVNDAPFVCLYFISSTYVFVLCLVA